VRATMSHDRLYEALDMLKRAHLPLVSVTPLGGSLEEYFLKKVQDPVEAHA
jgi:hypothetical protein